MAKMRSSRFTAPKRMARSHPDMTVRSKTMMAFALGLALPAAYVLLAFWSGGDMRQAAADYCAPERAGVHATMVMPANARSACALWGFR
jgi:hypothetical protein